MATDRLDAWFDDYAAAHRHPMNNRTHFVAIPVIVFHVLAMFDWVRFGPSLGGAQPSLGWLLALGAVAWYATLRLRLAVVAGALAVPLLALARLTPPWLVVALAVLAWTVQLAGHVIWEKNRPAFARNLAHTLIGPLYYLAWLLGERRPRRAPSAEG